MADQTPRPGPAAQVAIAITVAAVLVGLGWGCARVQCATWGGCDPRPTSTPTERHP